MVTGLSNGNDDDDIEVIGGVDPRFVAARDVRTMPFKAKSIAGWTRSFQGRLPYFL